MSSVTKPEVKHRIGSAFTASRLPLTEQSDPVPAFQKRYGLLQGLITPRYIPSYWLVPIILTSSQLRCRSVFRCTLRWQYVPSRTKMQSTSWRLVQLVSRIVKHFDIHFHYPTRKMHHHSMPLSKQWGQPYKALNSSWLKTLGRKSRNQEAHQWGMCCEVATRWR